LDNLDAVAPTADPTILTMIPINYTDYDANLEDQS
jgi:hypothetical protein